MFFQDILLIVWRQFVTFSIVACLLRVYCIDSCCTYTWLLHVYCVDSCCTYTWLLRVYCIDSCCMYTWLLRVYCIDSCCMYTRLLRVNCIDSCCMYTRLLHAQIVVAYTDECFPWVKWQARWWDGLNEHRMRDAPYVGPGAWLSGTILKKTMRWLFTIYYARWLKKQWGGPPRSSYSSGCCLHIMVVVCTKCCCVLRRLLHAQTVYMHIQLLHALTVVTCTYSCYTNRQLLHEQTFVTWTDSCYMNRQLFTVRWTYCYMNIQLHEHTFTWTDSCLHALAGVHALTPTVITCTYIYYLNHTCVQVHNDHVCRNVHLLLSIWFKLAMFWSTCCGHLSCDISAW